MQYVSTRNPDVRLSAAQAIVQGLSRDGGLLLPDSGATRAQAAVMICRMLDITV